MTAAGRHGCGMQSTLEPAAPVTEAPPKMPVVFVGHGSPMNAIEDNQWARRFRELGQALPRPKAILAISAHWFVPGTWLTSNAQPETIHDFGGFPKRLFEVQYPARGSDELARAVMDLLAPRGAGLSDQWGLDHGTWSVLVHVRPEADVPVVQLSIDYRRSAVEHLAIGKALAPLRERGVLILASGNVTHNLGHAFRALHKGELAQPAWAARFDREIETALAQRDHSYLLHALESEHGRISHPSPEHYLPLLYAFGASEERDPLSFPVTGWDASSLSMRAARFG